MLQSLILSTCQVQRPKRVRTEGARGVWKEDFLLGEVGGDALGCDSLELLQVSAAVNEMFHLYEADLQTELLRSARFGDWLSLIERSWQRGVKHLTVTTSGSTGRPKPCQHAFSTLQVEVDFLAGMFRGRRGIVAFTRAHHLYGLIFTAMLPDRLSCSVRDLAHFGEGNVEDEAASLEEGDLVVSFPQGWEWIDRNIPRFPADVEGVVSTAPCAPDLIESMMRGRLSGFTEVYGSSETAGVGTRSWPARQYSLMPQWNRKVAGDAAPDVLLHDAGFGVDVMDVLRFFPDGSFLVEGRRDRGVQVGGVNVFPALIAQRLKSHPGVAEASVRLMRPEEGDRLKCFVVPDGSESAEGLELLLQAWTASWPVAAERPKRITVGVAWPRGVDGKNSDWQ